MNKKIYLLSLFLLAFVFVACEETKEKGDYYDWQARNDAFIDSLQHVVDSKSDPLLFSVVDSRDKSQNIFFKRIKPGAGGLSPVLTSKVKYFHRGVFINEAIFGATPSPRFYTKQYKQLHVFSQDFKGDDPGELDSSSQGVVSGNVNGFIEILQWMKPGDRWEIYIPWKSGYGSTDNVDKATQAVIVPAFSTLIFDVELVEIVEY